MRIQPLQIEINGQEIQLGQELPKQITNVSIEYMFNVQVNPTQTPYIKAWLNTLVDNSTEDCVFMVNQVIIPKEDIKKF